MIDRIRRVFRATWRYALAVSIGAGMWQAGLYGYGARQEYVALKKEVIGTSWLLRTAMKRPESSCWDAMIAEQQKAAANVAGAPTPKTAPQSDGEAAGGAPEE